MSVNFDNAATTFPKPEAVKTACNTVFSRFGGNPGRSGHKLSLDTAAEVYSARKVCGDFFNAEPENIVFTLNCTHALNLAIKGIMKSGDHIIISDLEHNSVSRPVFSLSNQNSSFSVAHISTKDNETVKNFEELIAKNTKAICCTAASNVTGQITPIRKIANLCREKNLCFIVDACQAAGIIPITLSDGINIICTAGHKGLYGPFGTGLLISDGKYNLKTIIEGGTGSTSLDFNQPDFLPDMLESGTVNVLGIAGLKAGINFVNSLTLDRISKYEDSLAKLFINGISHTDNIIVYRNNASSYVPIVSFNIKDHKANDIAQRLSDAGFYLRGGLHCAALTHNSMGTAPDGTVRFSPSIFNNKEQVINLIKNVKNLANDY